MGKLLLHIWRKGKNQLIKIMVGHMSKLLLHNDLEFFRQILNNSTYVVL